MVDPHVEALIYRVKTNEPTDKFDNPPPIEVDENDFHVRLADGVATVEMKRHYASVEEARSRVEPFLESWETWVALKAGRRWFEFKFVNAKVIDRAPSTSQGQLVGPMVATAVCSVGNPTIVLTHRRYPEPPKRFAVSPKLKKLVKRYLACKEGREPLLSMAYFCLDYIERQFGQQQETEDACGGGKRERVAKKLGIDREVLKELGRITSTRGDEQTARKADERWEPSPLKPEEERFVEEVIKALILRLGEYEADPNGQFEKITLSQFPPVK